jgi:hypothetical protein
MKALNLAFIGACLILASSALWAQVASGGTGTIDATGGTATSGGTELIGPPVATDQPVTGGGTELVGPPVVDDGSLGIFYRDLDNTGDGSTTVGSGTVGVTGGAELIGQPVAPGTGTAVISPVGATGAEGDLGGYQRDLGTTGDGSVATGTGTAVISPAGITGAEGALGIYHRDDPVTIDAKDLDLPDDPMFSH